MESGPVTSQSLSVALIGLRHLHPRSYMLLLEACPETTVTAVVEADASVRDEFVKDFDVQGFDSVPGLLEAARPELAYIFLPHNECPEAAEQCAAAGVHVVVEKPVANTAEGARRVARACAEHEVLFSTPYLWRYHPVCREMKKLVDSGQLGRIVGCEGRCAAGGLHRYIEGHAGWMLEKERSGGGPMYNLGVHWIDLYRWLLDDE
ncbi:MAG: Gfo/Idh/MocA family protein, partial [Planctomycetota bacterium]